MKFLGNPKINCELKLFTRFLTFDKFDISWFIGKVVVVLIDLKDLHRSRK